MADAGELLRQPTNFNGFKAEILLHTTTELFLRSVVHESAQQQDWKYEELLRHADKLVRENGFPPGIKNQDAFRAVKSDRDLAAHHGQEPAVARLIENLPRIREVIFEVVRAFFKVEFDQLSRTDLLEDVNARNHLSQARAELERGDLRQGLWHAWKSYRLIIRNMPSLFEPSVSFMFGGVPRDLTMLTGLSPIDGGSPQGRGLWEVSEGLLEIEQALRLISLGLPTYQFYGLLAGMKILPEEVRYSDEYIDQGWNREPTHEEVRFCVDIVEEIAFRAELAGKKVPLSLVDADVY